MNQAIAFKLADMKMQIDAARLLVRSASDSACTRSWNSRRASGPYVKVNVGAEPAA